MIRKLMAVLTLVLLTQGCAASGTAEGDGGSEAISLRNNVISEQELAENPELSTVADAVRTLRPRWRDETVYVNDLPYAGSSRDIPMTFVRELRYLELSEAQMRWGQSISTPVIHVIRR